MENTVKVQKGDMVQPERQMSRLSLNKTYQVMVVDGTNIQIKNEREAQL